MTGRDHARRDASIMGSLAAMGASTTMPLCGKKTIALVNANISSSVTDDMVEIAQQTARGRLEIVGFTAPFGAQLITCEAELDEAARAVLALAPEIRADAVIVSAFGDPAVEALGGVLNRPVVGIAEASMRAAARGGRRFAIVTTTPGLVRRISERAVQLGLGAFCIGPLTTQGDAIALMRSPDDLTRCLRELAVRAVDELGAQAVIVGGGPLGGVARSLRNTLSVPLIEPIPEAVCYIGRMLGVPSFA
jgi:Asp/Glu/hydantoin racemase